MEVTTDVGGKSFGKTRKLQSFSFNNSVFTL